MKYNAPHPEFVKFDSKDNSSRKDFNFGDFRKSADLRIAIETVLWGWPARHLFEKRMLEYYLVYRHLCFARSMAILREHILLSINDLLGRVNFPSHLILKGLPTSDEFDKAIHELELGKISFRDALNLANFL